MSVSIVAGLIFAMSTVYGAWFWRDARPVWQWALLVLILLIDIGVWGLLVRKSGVSVTKATVLYDVVAIVIWYSSLLIWREESVTNFQVFGLVLVMIGSLTVALS